MAAAKYLTVSILFVFFISVDSWAFRCGSGLVTAGDTKTQVLVTCGKPASKEKSCENIQKYTTTNEYGKVKKSRKCDKKVEIWHYNCGEGDFIYALTFKNGILIKESTEGRGKGSSGCTGK